jgi:rhamnopyranosyl-N-acetylglucosaminyl-diphospho-decaprenol beta-1,3/1,4-galactofuranosyltransferase
MKATSSLRCYREYVEKNHFRVAAVLVAFNRDQLLERALIKTSEQTRQCDTIIVVDNAGLKSTRKLAARFDAIYITGSVENGSAGGFALGICYAIENGFDYIWTLDDDGYPDSKCLEELIRITTQCDLEVSSPLSLSQENHSQTANPYLFGFRKETSVSRIQKKEMWKGKVQFYNGMLMSRKIVQLIGVPRKELFLRGDEMDYFYRARGTKLPMALVTSALFYHPSGIPEFANSRNSILGVVMPLEPKKKYYQFRNRGYLVREYRLFLNGFYDWIRYPVFFLIYPGKNISGFHEWSQLWLQGFRRELKPYK